MASTRINESTIKRDWNTEPVKVNDPYNSPSNPDFPTSVNNRQFRKQMFLPATDTGNESSTTESDHDQKKASRILPKSVSELSTYDDPSHVGWDDGSGNGNTAGETPTPLMKPNLHTTEGPNGVGRRGGTGTEERSSMRLNSRNTSLDFNQRRDECCDEKPLDEDRGSVDRETFGDSNED